MNKEIDCSCGKKTFAGHRIFSAWPLIGLTSLLIIDKFCKTLLMLCENCPLKKTFCRSQDFFIMTTQDLTSLLIIDKHLQSFAKIVPFSKKPHPPVSTDFFTITQKYSRLRCLLCVKGLVICFYLGWAGSILQIRTNIIKVGSNWWPLTCSSKITLSLPSYTGSALKRELNFCNGHLSLLYFWYFLK